LEMDGLPILELEEARKKLLWKIYWQYKYNSIIYNCNLTERTQYATTSL
jgi:hypothetical protein